ncbi:transmembrane reductase CYB561D2-like [Uranotaenia lowii]|uniref:transmembrane reductase CYB561D2-like n=1 Tax=Uranotaenia lowii TaxID=190385 RepID=UPI00247A0C32|nr:transmembrane reductase CYB561D2-like [Uranotaenia lowii]
MMKENLVIETGSKVELLEQDHSQSLWKTGTFVLNTVNHMFIGFVCIYTAWICYVNGFEKIFTWHVLLCVFGFHLLMAEAILLFYSGNSWSQILQQPQRRTIHTVLQALGGVFIIVGIALEIYWREINNKRHFHGAHPILGLIALILVTISMCNGLGALYATELRMSIKPIYLKFGHSLLGLITFVIGMSAIVLGFDFRVFRENSTPELQTTLKVFTILVIFLSVPGALRTIASQVKTMMK